MKDVFNRGWLAPAVSHPRTRCSAAIDASHWSRIGVLGMLALVAALFTAEEQFYENHKARVADSQSVQNVEGRGRTRTSQPKSPMRSKRRWASEKGRIA